MQKEKRKTAAVPVNLVEDFVQTGLARFFGIRMLDVQIPPEHRLLFHCNVAAAAAAHLCVPLLSDRHSNDEPDATVATNEHHRFQQL